MKAQLFAVLILLGVIPMTIFAWVLIHTYYDEAINQRISSLQNHGNIISNLLVTTGYMTDNTISEVNSEIAQVANIYEGRILVVDNNLKIIKDSYALEEGKTLISKEAIKSFEGNKSQYTDKGKQYVEMTIPVNHPDSGKTVGVIIMSFSTKNMDTISDMLEQKATIIIITISTIVFLFAFFYSSKLTQPFKRVTSSIDRLSEGYMDEDVSIKGFSEMESISESFNQMISRMKQLEDSRQEFVSNVSHELKTPITSMKVLADSLLQQEGVPAELYQEFLVDIAEEIDRENKIINDLLSLVKLDKKSGEMHISTININELLEQIMKRLRPIAAKRNIELVFESFRPVIAEVDEVKISLALSNLIENAIKYNFDEGWVRVSLNADHKFFYVKVSDSGVGIPEDAQNAIFERFYRVDKARSRETGGTGLGLSITRNAILMHRGAIKVYSKENEGTTFTVRVPLNYIA
ncbi:signal transduction histidine kinase [Mobilisporobacter senegalensis]|uniref:histidine kinase n=1 Tax=Mobilisporobacter senegalensis TaxID=1329262 RepID=A0A3N1XWC3_9FIRM|nr:HAMP domain-containing sensor histidine kinase [Mobilisporobacter senegalensis]ROR30578.1 signal transduction histidine kinase [Mobilisporobacter senegalensis]